MSTVVGMYFNPQAANIAYDAVRAKGFPNSQLDILTMDDKSDAPKLTNLYKKTNKEDAEVYLAGVAKGGALVVADVPQSEVDKVSEILAATGAVDIDDRVSTLRDIDKNLKLRPAEDTEASQTIQLAAEKAAAGKQDVERKRLRVYTVAKERPVEAQIGLRDETVHVERRAINRNVALTDELFKPHSIEMSEVDQEAFVTKSAVITDEIQLKKDAVENLKTLKETLRYTDIAVDEQDTGKVIGRQETTTEFRPAAQA